MVHVVCAGSTGDFLLMGRERHDDYENPENEAA